MIKGVPPTITVYHLLLNSTLIGTHGIAAFSKRLLRSCDPDHKNTFDIFHLAFHCWFYFNDWDLYSTTWYTIYVWWMWLSHQENLHLLGSVDVFNVYFKCPESSARSLMQAHCITSVFQTLINVSRALCNEHHSIHSTYLLIFCVLSFDILIVRILWSFWRILTSVTQACISRYSHI